MGQLRDNKKNNTKAPNSDYECQYSFGSPEVAAFNYNEETMTYEGITAKFSSEQHCDKNTKKPFTVHFNVTCN